MAAMREFGTKSPGDRKTKKTKAVEFMLDGDVLRAVKPKNAAMLNLAQADQGETIDKVQAILTFMNNVLDAPSRLILNRRLNDPEDDLDLDSPEMAEVIEWLVEELIEVPDPTGQSSGSTSRRRSTGAGSTGRQRAQG